MWPRIPGYVPRSFEHKLDFSEHASVTNAAAPGDLIRATLDGRKVYVTDIIIYNAAAAAVITFYDEDSEIKAVFSVGNLETAVISLNTSIVYLGKDIYARTDQGVNAEITVAGVELPAGL